MNLNVIENGLINIYENDNREQLVNARELHEFLNVSTRYNDWIKNRIDKYGFIKGEDFITLTENLVSGGRQNIHVLKLDMAKEIAMVENNEKGRLIRRYFIEIEKKYRQQIFKVNELSPELQMFNQILQSLAVAELKAKEIENRLHINEFRLNNLDASNIEGTPRQRLSQIIKKYAFNEGVPYNTAWYEFRRNFNTAYRMNIEHRKNNYQAKAGLKKLTYPDYFERVGLIEDALRVADKMLNQSAVINA